MLHDSFVYDVPRSNSWIILIFYMQIDIQEMEKLIVTIWMGVVKNVQTFLILRKIPRETPSRSYVFICFENGLKWIIKAFMSAAILETNLLNTSVALI